jgi:UDP-N-acetylmuramate dehydrogenase
VNAAARELVIEPARALAPLTTLGLGGQAAQLATVHTRAQLVEALAYARREQLPLGILGGGSNLIVADAGFAGLVVRIATRGIELTRGPVSSLLTVQAGEPWDDVVELAVTERLAGIECLSGIPGSTGATPIQNVGAYGQEVSDVIDAVEVLDRSTGESAWLSADACAFGYRNSRFKREPERHVVLATRFVLRSEGTPVLRYGELSRALAGGTPGLRDVQKAVRALRASKGMLIDEHHERSVGSFFMNPIVRVEEADDVAARAVARGVIHEASELPRHLAAGGVKLAAGWLVEHAGIAKGLRRGHVGVSSRHALALVHHGGGSTSELMALAAEVQTKVRAAFGITLQIEPVRWG